MLKFEQKGWNLLKFWNLSKKVGIDWDVELWARRWESIQMLKFQQKRGNRLTCWNLSKKVETY